MNTWRNVTINDLGQIITGSTPPTKKTEYYGNKYPFINLPVKTPCFSLGM